MNLQRTNNETHVPYLKMHGTGNVILLVDRREDGRAPPAAEKLRELGNDKTGPGFDQLLWMGPASDGRSVASYRVFNADGSEVQQCGNGLRCLARYLARGAPGDQAFDLQSPAGTVSARVFDDGSVAVNMGAPVFEPAAIPFVADARAVRYPIETGDRVLQIAALSMGNPHAVVEVDAVGTAEVAEIGSAIEHHARFPERANVGFMAVRDRGNIDLRVHERGVGETAACGTGACAAVVAGQQFGLLDEVVAVHLPGGQVVVSWRGGDAPVWLKGNAEFISEGTLTLDDVSTGTSEI